MATILKFTPRPRTDLQPFKRGGGDILFFTGVRYEKLAEAAADVQKRIVRRRRSRARAVPAV